MSTLFADRAFISINGVEVLDIESADLKRNYGTKVVPTMSRNRRNKGTVKGNLEIDLSITVAVQNQLGTPKLEDINFESNDVALTFEHGADRYTCTGLDLKDVDQNASGVGSEGKKVWNLIALDVIDQVGNSSLFNIKLKK